MKYNFFSLEDFNIVKHDKGWYYIHCKPLGRYLMNIESVEMTKLPDNLLISVLDEIISNIVNNKKIIPHSISSPARFFKRKEVPRLMLFPTAACNLNCIYCHCSSDNSQAHMDEKMLYASVDKYLEYVNNVAQSIDNIEITFMGGGEPFIRFRQIKDVVSYIKDLGVNGQYSIVTNATLGSEQDWEWLLSHNFKITISADGPPHIQNFQRTNVANLNTSSRLENRLNYLSSHNATVNIRSTVLGTSEETIDTICDYFMQFDCVRTHHLEPISFAGRGNAIEDNKDLSLFYGNFFKFYSKYLYSNPSRFKSAWFKPFQKSDGYCGAVYNNAIVTHDGYISLCTEVDSKSLNSEIGNEYLVSQIWDDNPFSSLKSKTFSKNHSVYKMPNCKECVIRYKCGGGCYIKKDRDFPGKIDSFYQAFCKHIIPLHLSYILQVYENSLANENRVDK
ncbi:MAG: radical SAM protein [Saprospirales bacterium]|nr:radical SAM protein [Saprospirales bacterium]